MDGLTTALGPALDSDSDEAATVFLRTAERMLRDLVAAGETDRSVAESLLTIDALTTYALESATEMVPKLDAFASDAITRLSNTGVPHEELPRNE
jgi:uncharacterized membrane protein